MNQADIMDLVKKCASKLNIPIKCNEDPKGWSSVKIDVPGRKQPYALFVYNDGSDSHIAVNTEIDSNVPYSHRCNAKPKHRLNNTNSARWDLRFPKGTTVKDLKPIIENVLQGNNPYVP